MKTFKTFLEAKAEGSLKQVFEPLTTRPITFYLNEHCPDLFWMLKEQQPFYRGMRAGLGFSYVDLTKTKRKSQNTSNWYTTIFDNHPEMKDFPKRSQSMICTTNLVYAKGFGDERYIVLPVKNAKIGEVGDLDIWEKIIDLFGNLEPINEMNDYLAAFVETGLNTGLDTETDPFELLKQFDAQIRDVDSEAYERIQQSDYSELLQNDDFRKHFLETILDAYSPSKLQMRACTPATLRHSEKHQEVWFDGGAIVIPQNVWDKMRKLVETNPEIKSWQDLSEHMK
jgi:hypothetical protein